MVFFSLFNMFKTHVISKNSKFKRCMEIHLMWCLQQCSDKGNRYPYFRGVYLKPEEAKPLSPKLTNSWHKVTKGLNKGFKKS